MYLKLSTLPQSLLNYHNHTFVNKIMGKVLNESVGLAEERCSAKWSFSFC